MEMFQNIFVRKGNMNTLISDIWRQKCIVDFTFSKIHLHVLFEVLKISDRVGTAQGTVWKYRIIIYFD